MEVCLLGIKLREICGLVGAGWGLWVYGMKWAHETEKMETRV